MNRTAPFSLASPHSLSEAARVLASTPGARLLAGGTDLIPAARRGLCNAPLLVDLAGITELHEIAFTHGFLTIGAGVTLTRLAADPQIEHALPVVAEAAATIAGPGHRSVATLGGNLCLDTRCMFYNQSEWWREANDHCLKLGGEVCHVAPQGNHCHAAFSGDLAPALLVSGAEVAIASADGTRQMPLSDLYADDGAAHLTLRPGEIVTSVIVPAQPANARAGYRKARARGAIDFPLAGVAVRIELRADGCVAGLRVALTGTNSRPLLLDGTDALAGMAVDEPLLAQLGKLVQRQASPMRTTVTHAHWRRQVAAVIAQRLVRELIT